MSYIKQKVLVSILFTRTYSIIKSEPEGFKMGDSHTLLIINRIRLQPNEIKPFNTVRKLLLSLSDRHK